ncbi:hypothetical protein DTO164E3_5685 [Paecilomyces variotii]|nr:hypothetical protein DTO164E3_5685 [Paecilomyces variotii]KAJ9220783.1 hypothetical protein DTO169C6_6868 [Paecilomyces variotii]KAJ9356176.1 hypothetical protein DTO027B9_3718 [Paecilomyces variotii]
MTTEATISPMVSHPQVLGRSTPMPPQALSSRHTHTRRHRYGRSHHGGSSYQPQNEFPIFTHTGDVEIIISAGGQERRYLLHRLILAQCSGFFEASTSEEWSRSQAQSATQTSSRTEQQLPCIDEDDPQSAAPLHANQGSATGSGVAGKKRWRYELDWENREEDEEPILVQKAPSSTTVFGGDFAPPPPSTTKPSAPQAGFFRSMANLAGMQSTLRLPNTAVEEAPVDPLIRDYDNLFRIFYNYPPVLNSMNIASAYAECKALLGLADMYDALPVTGSRVDHHLLRFGSRLFKQIAKYPPSYLKLGYLARSRIIFSEALIHVVGQWPAALPHLREAPYSPIPDSVLDLIEDKVDDLEELKARVESKLFRLSLTTSRGERVSPANAYLDWLAVSLFRQWLVENTTPPPAPILKNSAQNANAGNANSTNQNTTAAAPRSAPTQPPFNPGRVYRLLGSSSSQAYLPRDELKRFLKLHPGSSSSDSFYSRDNLKRFERKMEEIKRLAREIVKPLMRNFLELDLRGNDGGGSSGGSGVGDGGLGGLPYLTCTKVDDQDLPWD